MDYTPILGQGYGYGFALGLGAAFALVMVVISNFLSLFMGQKQNSERFSTASRTVRSGLIASSTVSAWCWPATLLTSGSWSYNFGVAGSWFYACNGIMHLVMFMFLATQLKLKAPKAHTVSECFSVRYGRIGHGVYLAYCLATNILISVLLLLGGSQGFAAVTGMNVVAAAFLLPLTVIVYTALGGLKATFISDWIHTVIIYVILLVTCFKIYTSSPLIGSPGKMYDLLREADISFPGTGTSFLSFHNTKLMLTAWSVMFSGCASVLGDPGYSQRALASSPKSVFSGYLIGGVAWMAIPFALGSSGGLACRALLGNEASVTYPNALSTYEVGAGLPVIYGMTAVFGKTGAAMGLTMLFMSVTSATSAELIAFASVSTYDIYRMYINPLATGKQLVRASHLSVVLYGIFIGAVAVGFNYAGVTVGWLLSFLGIIVDPICRMFWGKMSKWAILIGCPLATISGIVCWCCSAYAFYGEVNNTSLSDTRCTLVGTAVSLTSSLIYIVVISYIKPDNFDFSVFQYEIKAADDIDQEEKDALYLDESAKQLLEKQSKYNTYLNLVVLLGLCILMNVTMFGVGTVLSKKSFTGWMVIMLIWLLCSAAVIVVLPLWQGKEAIWIVVTALLKLGKGGMKVDEKSEVAEYKGSSPSSSVHNDKGVSEVKVLEQSV